MTKHVIVDTVEDALRASSKAWRTPPCSSCLLSNQKSLQDLSQSTLQSNLGFRVFLRINPVLNEIPEAPLSLFAGFVSIFRQSVRVTTSGKAADQPSFTTLFASLKPWRTEKSFNW